MGARRTVARMLLRGLLVVLISVWVALLLGSVLPRLLIGPGTGELRGDQAEFAGFARSQAGDGGIFLFGDLGFMRITEVRKVPVVEECLLGPAPTFAPRGYEARFEEYGLFGVPLGTGAVKQCLEVDRTNFYFDERGERRPDPPAPFALYRNLYIVGYSWPLLAQFSSPMLAGGGIFSLRTGIAADRRLGVAALAVAALLPAWLVFACVWDQFLFWRSML